MSLPSKKAIQVDENITHYQYKMLNHEMILKYDESTEGPVTWEAHTDMVTLRREQDGWKIYDIKMRED